MLTNAPFSLKVDDIGADKDFAELGLDSLDVATFLSGIESELNVTIPMHESAGFTNLADVAAYLQAIGQED